jgi:Glycosyltransferase family 87
MNQPFEDVRAHTAIIRTLETLLFAAAIVSLAYAVITAPSRGFDIKLFHDGAEQWVEGARKIGEGPILAYPPFAIVLLAPLALLSTGHLIVVWLGVNLASTATVLYLVIKLYGSRWPVRVQACLVALFLCWAPFRVCVRNGQVSIVLTAVLLAIVLARSYGMKVVAGVLLGVAVGRYHFTYAFFLYFLWKREWKIVAISLLVPALLTVVYALRMEQSVVSVVREYTAILPTISNPTYGRFVGRTEISPLVLDLTGGDARVTSIVDGVLALGAILASWAVFRRRPESEKAHLAVLAVFTLWPMYHRVYDAVLLIVPAAMLIDLLVRGQHRRFSVGWLIGLGLFAFSIPGVIEGRFGALRSGPLLSLLGAAGAHLERGIVFGLFWSLLFLLWKNDERIMGQAE